MNWESLMKRISKDISDLSRNIKLYDSEKHPSDIFFNVLKQFPNKRRLLLIFDEIEYISPLSSLDPHWVNDFVSFWQTMWSCQSHIPKLSFIVAGVNPTLSEKDRMSGVQNPMFGIVKQVFLKGFDATELDQMLSSFGDRMGMNFTTCARKYLLARYGGHPLLTRVACSFTHQKINASCNRRPIQIDHDFLKRDEIERERELCFYCNHVVSEIEEFYSDEYDMLEMLAAQELPEFREFAEDPELTRHLKAYGLIETPEAQRPRFAIPVVGQYIADVKRRRERRSIKNYVVPEGQRQGWIDRRISAILRDSRALDGAVEEAKWPPIYGGNGIAEAESFSQITVNSDKKDFEFFINAMNRCFVEPIEKIGKKRGYGQYFWYEFRKNYPELQCAFRRVKAYRNWKFHLELNTCAKNEFEEFFALDVDGIHPENLESGYFVIKQKILDEIHVSLQLELEKVM